MPFSSYGWCLLKKLPFVSHLPDPDLLVGAGHACHIPMLMTRRVCGGRTLVLMMPSLPTRFFDLCLIPEHDRPKEAENILPTVGPLNQLSCSKHLSSDTGLMLIGGESKHFSWDEKRLHQQLLDIIERDDINWTITDSPRTPASTRVLLQALNKGKVNYLPFADKTASALPDLLQRAGTVWVSEDSMSMIYEALSTGAAVGILRVQRKNEGRLAQVAQSLANKGLLTLFDDWLSGQALVPPAQPLSESIRCAEAVLERLGWAVAKPV
jgi:uncharacterized protein